MNKGQVQLGTYLVIGVISFGGAWLGNYVLNSPQASANALSAMQSDVKVLQNQQVSQDAEILTITENLKVMNDNIVKLLVASHIEPSTR